MSYTNSIVLGVDNNKKLYHADGYQHILLLAPHGFGKGVSIVLPTLLTLDESCIVHDIKLENYQLTSGYRKSIGHQIFVFDPLNSNYKTHRYNPLDFIGSDIKKQINELQKIANLLIRENETSKILFVALVLYILATNRTNTLGEVARIINRNLEQEISEGLTKIDKLINQDCYIILSDFLSQSQSIKNNAIKQLRKSLYLWTNPFIDYATSASDFDIALLKKSKATIYVGLNPSDISRIEPLMQFFYNHSFERLIIATESIDYKENIGVTVILDEFYTIGKLEKYSFAYCRGYKIRLFAIASNIQCIEELYGEKQSSCIIADCTFKVFFTATDPKTAQYISSLCLNKNNNVALISWQEIMNLPQDLQIILCNKEQPVICKKIKYYEDNTLKSRIIAPDYILT